MFKRYTGMTTMIESSLRLWNMKDTLELIPEFSKVIRFPR